jgi:3-isopropylmalate dehydratase small subunit
MLTRSPADEAKAQRDAGRNAASIFESLMTHGCSKEVAAWALSHAGFSAAEVAKAKKSYK